MVKITVKRTNEPQFLYETTVETSIDSLLQDIATIYNGRLKVQRISAELEDLSKHGITLPPNMQGLTDDQIVDLKLKDEFAEKCRPSGGSIQRKDEIGRRNGIAPNQQMADILTKTCKEAKDMISKKKIEADICVTQKTVKDALDILRGAVMIVYPMGLPPYDPVRMELENKEDLSGTQASLEVIPIESADLWWAGKQLLRGKKLGDFVGKNEKTKIVAKLQKVGQGAPCREPIISEDEQKQMMAYYYRKQEESKKLSADMDDSYLDAKWADNQMLKKQFQGLSDIKWGPR